MHRSGGKGHPPPCAAAGDLPPGGSAEPLLQTPPDLGAKCRTNTGSSGTPRARPGGGGNRSAHAAQPSPAPRSGHCCGVLSAGGRSGQGLFPPHRSGGEDPDVSRLAGCPGSYSAGRACSKGITELSTDLSVCLVLGPSPSRPTHKETEAQKD